MENDNVHITKQIGSSDHFIFGFGPMVIGTQNTPAQGN